MNPRTFRFVDSRRFNGGAVQHGKIEPMRPEDETFWRLGRERNPERKSV